MEVESRSVVWAGLELSAILLLQFPECCYYNHEPSTRLEFSFIAVSYLVALTQWFPVSAGTMARLKSPRSSLRLHGGVYMSICKQGVYGMKAA